MKKIRRKRATVAPYSMLYRFLCNALQRAKQPQEPFAITARLQTLQVTQVTQMTQTSFLSLCPLFG